MRSDTAPTSDTRDQALLVSFFSVVVKIDAVVRRYPGGVEGLNAMHGIVRRNGTLAVIVSMSADEAGVIVENLRGSGLEPGKDIAVGDMMQGELLRCDGIVFESSGDWKAPRWDVRSAISE